MSKNKLVGVHGMDFECHIKWDGVGFPHIKVCNGHFIGDGESSGDAIVIEGVANLLLDYAAKIRYENVMQTDNTNYCLIVM